MPIFFKQKGCESDIRDHDRDLLVTMVKCKDLPDSDRGDLRYRRAVDLSTSLDWRGVVFFFLSYITGIVMALYL